MWPHTVKLASRVSHFESTHVLPPVHKNESVAHPVMEAADAAAPVDITFRWGLILRLGNCLLEQWDFHWPWQWLVIDDPLAVRSDSKCPLSTKPAMEEIVKIRCVAQ